MGVIASDGKIASIGVMGVTVIFDSTTNDTHDSTMKDTEGPKITLTEPSKDGSTVGTSSLTLNLVCTDESGIVSLTGTFGDKPLEVAAGKNNIYSVTVNDLSVGENTITFSATDSSSNKNQTIESFNVLYDPTMSDKEEPKIELIKPARMDSTVYSSSVTVMIICTDKSGVRSVTCIFNNQPLSVIKGSNNYYSVNVTDLTVGKNILTFTAVDNSSNGNTSTVNVTVIYDIAISSSMKMAVRENYSLFLKPDGTLWACGGNSVSQLGDGTTTDRYTPVQVMSGVQSMAVGWYFTLILKTDDILWACGSNYYGQLGDGTTTKRLTYVQVMRGVQSMKAGGSHSLILKTDGTLWACGYNKYGQLGDGTTIDRHTPVQVMRGVQSMAAGGTYSLILKTDGTLWACGNNRFGQLGDGTTADRVTPVQVMSGVQKISTYSSHSLILKTDGTLWACGDNNNGQFGDGTETDRLTPVRVMNNVQSMEAGGWHSLILKTDGTLWGCGYNKHGQLGDGTYDDGTTNINRSTPVRINF